MSSVRLRRELMAEVGLELSTGPPRLGHQQVVRAGHVAGVTPGL